MLVLVTYDVNTVDASGKRRLRQVAIKCMAYGQRVQNSVFECNVDASQLKRLQAELKNLIEPATDSLRFYSLGNNYQGKVEHYGAKQTYEAEGVLMI